MAGVTADLELSLDAALSSVADLDAAITSATTGITLDVTADASAVTSSIDDAVASADVQPVAVDADASTIATSIDDAVASADVPPIDVEADTSAAQAAIDDLGSSAESASGGVDSLSGSTDALAAGSGLLAGNIGGTLSKLGPMGAAAGAAAAGIGLLFNAGLTATSQIERFNLVTGQSAAAVRSINVGGLSGDLADLSVKLGSSGEAALNSAASLFQLGTTSGATRDQVTGTTQDVAALALRARALNPALGSVSTIQDGLSKALARGGKFASNFGLSLTSAEINARALKDTGKQTNAELTQFDKIAAGAAIATARLGHSLGTDVANGSKNAQIQVDKMKQSMEEAIKRIGEKVTPVGILALSAAAKVAITDLDGLGNALDLLGNVVPGGGSLGGGSGGLAHNLERIGVDITQILNPVTLATRAFHGLGNGLTFLQEHTGHDTITPQLEAMAGAARVGAAVGHQLAQSHDEASLAAHFHAQSEDEAAKAIADFTKSATSSLPNFADAVNQAKQAGAAFGVINAESDPATVERNIFAMIVAIKDFTKNLGQLASTPLTFSFISQLGPQVGGQLAASLAKATPAVRAGFEQLLAVGQISVQAFVNLIRDHGGDVNAAWQAVNAGNLNVLRNMEPQFGQAGVDSGRRHAAGVSSTAGDNRTAGVGIGRSGFQAVASQRGGFATAGRGNAGAAVGGVLSQSGAASAAGSSLGKSAAGGLRQASGAANNAGVGVGQSFTQGIASGIGGAAGAAINAAINVVSQANAAAAAHLNINSPSRLTRDTVGKPFGMGIAVGIASQTSGVVAAAEELTRAAALGAGSVAAVSGAGVSASGGANVVHVHQVLPAGTTPAQARELAHAGTAGGMDALARRRVSNAARRG